MHTIKKCLIGYLAIVNKKVKAAFANELKPIVCVGETLEQKEAGITEKIITEQTNQEESEK